MDTGCLSSMNITGVNQARSFAGQLPTQRCFPSSHLASFAVKSLVLRNKGRSSQRRHSALQVQFFVHFFSCFQAISCENITN
jgi:15-cis-phytoene desaturase